MRFHAQAPSPKPQDPDTLANRGAQDQRSPLRREPASTRGVVRAPAARRARRTGDPAGQGTVVHQPARPRCRRAHRARVRRAGRGGHQAHQPVRRRDRRHHRRSLRARARGGCACRVRRHHRPQSHARRRRPPAPSSRPSSKRSSLPPSTTRARTILAAKANLRLVVADFTQGRAIPAEYRSILGAMLVQERDRVIEAQRRGPLTGSRS